MEDHDAEVIELFSPHGSGKGPRLAIGMGRDPQFRPLGLCPGDG
jgi:hypothetical protein